MNQTTLNKVFAGSNKTLRIKSFPRFSLVLFIVLIAFNTCEKPERVIKLTTLNVSTADISYTSVTLKGEITDLGSAPIEDHGIIISDNVKPGIGNEQVKSLGELSTKGVFQVVAENLAVNTSYYFRAFVRVKDEDIYGNVKEFKTKDTQTATVTAGTVIEVTLNSAKLDGNVTSDGGETVTKKGLCWNNTANPTINNCLDTTVNGVGLGDFTGLIHGLIPATQYYVRTYATNAKGTSYNNSDITFTTKANPASPVYVSSRIENANPSLLEMTYSLTLANIVPAASAFTVMVNSVARTINVVAISGAKVMLTLDSAIVYGDIVTVAYTKPGSNPIQTPSGGQAATIIAQSVTNYCITIPTISTTIITSRTATTVSSGGNISNNGGSSITARGVCWSTTPDPTITDSKTTDGNGEGSFTSSITGLTPSTTYHVRAYATNSAGTAYGEDVNFNTLCLASITTTAISSRTATTATSGGNVTSDCGSTVTARGVCWSTAPDPTITDSKTTDDNGEGSFTSSITGLTPSTTYHVRAYAISSAGTAYGEDVVFNTYCLPSITTTAISSITYTTATSGGNTTSCAAAVSAFGVCWSTNPNPTISDSKTIDGTGEGSFTSSITGLTPGTTYHVRAYATSFAGTGYGADVAFITLQLPTATTTSATAITLTTATINGIANANNFSTTVSFEYGTTDSYGTMVTAMPNTVTGTSDVNISAEISGLTQSTLYHYRVKAVNAAGTSYGNDMTFTTGIVDVESNFYNVVTIGTQKWMKENLKTIKYNDGTSIPLVTDSAAWSHLSTPAYCWYENDASTFKDTYGAYYNWYTVNQGKLCPTGWHIPTNTECTTLSTYLGGNTVSGGKMKETGTTHWISPNTDATNESGFTGLPGGFRDNYGLFWPPSLISLVGDNGYWWMSSEKDADKAWYFNLDVLDGKFRTSQVNKGFGFSIRCVKD